MRKISSAILMGLLLFNWFGYRLLTDYMQHRSDIQLESRLDKNKYDESQLIEIKVPVSVPYQTTWSSFERYDGEVEMNGILYKYVKRKLINDTLVLLCIPNQNKMDLQTAKDDFFKNSNDLSNTSKKSGIPTTFKKLMNDYDDHKHSFLLTLTYDRLEYKNNQVAGNIITTPHQSPEQPPDVLFL